VHRSTPCAVHAADDPREDGARHWKASLVIEVNHTPKDLGSSAAESAHEHHGGKAFVDRECLSQGQIDFFFNPASISTTT